MNNTPEGLNTEREKGNLLCLMKLTLNTLIDQSSSATASPVLDDRNSDVTNFILTLERVLNFRMRPNWLSERRFFWDFVRPACIGSARPTIIERVEEVSKTRSIKEKGRTWIKFALMEKKLSELLKLVISDCHLCRKYYYDDSILISSQAFILCDQLAGLSAIDFSFCFKQSGSTLEPPSIQNLDIDVIDLTPYLFYKSKSLKQYLREQNADDENKQPMPILTALNEMKPLNSPDREMVSLEKYKLEVEQRKYFEELLKHRDREYQQMKSRFEALKSDREKEVVLMENIILELQLQLGLARTEAELKHKPSPPQAEAKSPTKSFFDLAKQKMKSSNHSTSKNDPTDVDMGFIPSSTLITETNIVTVDQVPSTDCLCPPSQLSRRSSHSTTASTTEDDQYELVRHLPSNDNNESNGNTRDMKATSSPELLSSTTSLSSSSSSSSSDDETHENIVTTNEQIPKPIIQESGHFEPVEITVEQANLLEEASTTE